MSYRHLLHTPWARSLRPHPPSPAHTARARISRPARRFESTSPGSQPPPPSSPGAADPVKQQKRIHKVLDRLPKFLRKYTDSLRSAPVSNVAAFLILHEITAIVPLIGLASFFHYTQWLPAYFSEGKYIADGIEKFGGYFRRKGWFGFDKEEGKRVKLWNYSEKGSRIVSEVATAYAVTKLFLPLRVIISVALTPWFARHFVVRLGGKLKGLFRRGKKETSKTVKQVEDKTGS